MRDLCGPWVGYSQYKRPLGLYITAQSHSHVVVCFRGHSRPAAHDREAWQITQPELVTEPSARQLKVDPAATATLLGPVEPSYRVPPMVT